DKDAEVYKFYINSLYVAITRSIKNIYLFEKQLNHRILQLLALKENNQPLQVSEEKSDMREWLAEADRLEGQGKYEQAEQIRAKMHGYAYISPEQLEQIKTLALDPDKKEAEVKKERKQLFQYASKRLMIDWIEQLAELGFHRAVLFMKEVRQDRKEYLKSCRLGRQGEVDRVIRKYGVDFPLSGQGPTGLMMALYHGQNELPGHFLKQKADINKRTGEGLLAVHYLLEGFFKNEFHKDLSMADLTILLKYWYAVRPSSLTIQTHLQRFSVSGHSMLFFLLICMRCLDEEVPSKVAFKFHDPATPDRDAAVFSMDMIMRFIIHVPDEVLPPYRKKRSYVNSILAMHEVDRDHPYNKQAFKRVDRGCYSLNPVLAIVDQ
ncbi:MAG TPA: hypothetical protein VFX43_12580, partial [Chitinophagaceae bacterium]|nr:hypothetical protein [Chitinophagaceae bacterium]